jgi:rhodanese-related sulfurtransferase
MKRFLYTTTFLFGIFFISCGQQQQGQQGVDEVNLGGKAFAEGLQSNPNAVLIDVRTPAEFEAGHIPGAKIIDFYASDFKTTIEQLDRTKSYYLYCRSGNRSGQTISMMEGLGFEDVVHLGSGIGTWGGELVSGN